MITIYLDIDWVLNNYKSYDYDEYWLDICKQNINLFLNTLKQIKAKSRVKLILSSDWKYIPENVSLLESAYSICFSGTTEKTLETWMIPKEWLEKLRVIEIEKHIVENKIEKYIVIDDMSLQIKNAIKVQSQKWFTEDTQQKLLELVDKLLREEV